jgi:hypothetical protein
MSYARVAAALSGLILVTLCGARESDDPPAKLPFAIGERLTYEVTLAKGGTIGESAMWVDGPADVRGTRTYVLNFDSRVRVALFRGISTSTSWFDPVKRSSLRFQKHERNLLSREDVSVDLYPAERKWKSAAGESGSSPSDSSLDELSFIFFIRTLPLTPGAAFTFDRHFDAARNPVLVKVVRREVTATPIGELHTVLVEMRVRDPRHYNGEGLIRINLTDDDCRVPARIETTMPIVGKAIMTIKSERSPVACSGR